MAGTQTHEDDPFGNRTDQAHWGEVGYNADGQICAVHNMTGMTEYIYDAEGRRVAEGSISAWSCDTATNGFTVTADYVRDQAGHQLSEFAPGQNGTMVWQHTNVYANGELIATEDNTEAHFYLNDWLGTRRVQTDYLGVTEQKCFSLPYGDGESCAPTPTENLFTGKERDAESGLDYFGARYYASTMGRFLSPDPGWALAADPTNPQTWNQYAYALNNPLINIDPDGLDCVYFNDAGNGIESVDQNSNSGECGENGGDWINGTVQSAQYFSDSDTWGFRSSDSSDSYTTYANAPGPESSGIPCSGNCDLANGYFQSSPIPTDDDSLNPFAQSVFTETWKQSGFLLNWGNTIAGCAAQNYGLTGAAAATGAAGYPVAKSALGVGRGLGGDASPYTSALGAAAFKAFGANEPRFTGAVGRLAKNLTGTARMAGAAGRVAQKAAPVLAAADAASIGYCVYSTVTR